MPNQPTIPESEARILTNLYAAPDCPAVVRRHIQRALMATTPFSIAGSLWRAYFEVNPKSTLGLWLRAMAASATRRLDQDKLSRQLTGRKATMLGIPAQSVSV